MSKIPSELLYTNSHEWILQENDGIVRVGLTDHAQNAMGDLVFVDLPSVDAQIKIGAECCTVESVKAASDIVAPVSGTVVEINDKLEGWPSLVNNDPYGDGWLFRITPSAPAELRGLLSADDYKKLEKDRF